MDKPLYSFGIITDTHIRAPRGDFSSPYPVNERANARARYAIALLEAQSPEFVVHLGDMVHPLPAMPAYDDACNEALQLFKPLIPRLHFVAGNHDIGDKPMPGSPAAIVDANAISRYSSHFGAQWYSFQYNDSCILVINSSLINTASDAEHQQYQWLQQELQANSDKRLILFSHYPPFLHNIDEHEHYDNIAPPGRQSLLALIAQHQIELVFSGHVHQFFYNRYADTCFYTLPPTSFTRQDYAELFKTLPATEFGRDDLQKYSVAMVDIYPQGHRLRLLPTQGIEIDALQAPTAADSLYRTPARKKNLIVSFRHAWHESIDLPYNGPMEEFSRKRAHNDYGLLRLLQMGIDQVRIPLQDLLENNSRQRMTDYAALGIRFHVFCKVEQLAVALEAIRQHPGLASTLECVMPGDLQEWQALVPNQFTGTLAIPVHLGYACSGAHNTRSDKPFAHTVTSGFQCSDLSTVLDQIAAQPLLAQCSGLVFQIPWDRPLAGTLQKLQQAFATLPYHAMVNLRLACENPAEANTDDAAIADRVLDALELVSNCPDLTLQLDTFADIDRGYAPRHGLVDRRYNLREAGQRLVQW